MNFYYLIPILLCLPYACFSDYAIYVGPDMGNSSNMPLFPDINQAFQNIQAGSINQIILLGDLLTLNSSISISNSWIIIW